MRTFVLSVAVGWLIANAAIAGEACKAPAACGEVHTCGGADRCGHCGCQCCCQKWCQVVCEMKEIKKIVWIVHCEDFCAAAPLAALQRCGDCDSCKAADCNEAACGEGSGEKCNPCASEESKRPVPPKCGKVREKKAGKGGGDLQGALLQMCGGLLLPACDAQDVDEKPAPAPVAGPPPRLPGPNKTTEVALPVPPVAAHSIPVL